MIACLHFFTFYYPAKSIFRSKCQKLKRLFYTLRNTIFNWNETRKPTDNTKESEIWKYMAQLHGNDNTGFSSFSVKYSRRIRSFRRIIFPRAWGIKGFNLTVNRQFGDGGYNVINYPWRRENLEENVANDMKWIYRYLKNVSVIYFCFSFRLRCLASSPCKRVLLSHCDATCFLKIPNKIGRNLWRIKRYHISYKVGYPI